MDSSPNRTGKPPSGSERALQTFSLSPSCGPVTKPARGATMRQEAVSLFLCYLLLFAGGGAQAGKRQREKEGSEGGGSGFWGAVTYMAIGGGLLAAGLPALGFTSTGIAANSVAASLMSMSAVANGGGVPAGGLVATLQSLGTSGGSALMGKIGAFLGYAVHKHLENSKEEPEDEE
uniref:interferon alpha-inducible protein 6 isoform X1 n=2 Tax=Halichoerus grypus TaxID=9711 RepID=UPI0016599A61|nr:interferon alpha-inducible protein 6 isoform X1 [Halichoerus grypus]